MGGRHCWGTKCPWVRIRFLFGKIPEDRQPVRLLYMGDGAVRQGAHSTNLKLCHAVEATRNFVIENNGYAMGTSVQRTSNVTELYTLGESK